jgi:uncharacterized protein YdaU (DUF1376 family)
MNYYPFHVGDYTTHTAHLDPIEDLAYRRMLDMYYLREEPLPASVPDVARLIRLRDHEQQVESVLSEFFHLSPDGWRQGRCDAEIGKMQDLQQKQREKANKRWRGSGNADAVQKESSSNATAMPRQCQSNAKAMPPTPIPIPIEEQKPSGDCSPDVPTSPVPAKACEPPADPPEPTSIRRQQGCTFTTFVAECQAKGEKPIPKDHPVFRFADDARIPVEFVRLAWLEFRRDFGEGGKSAKKRQAGMRGWRQHFDNAVRKGWYRLWAFDRQGECYLTPAGVALQREAEAEARDAA